MALRRRAGADQVRWNHTTEYLLTLCSLGEVSGMTLESLKTVLPPVAAKFPQMTLEVKGFGGTPSMLQPRFVYAAIEGPDLAALEELAKTISAACAPYAPNRDPRPFLPHIMLGRLKTE